MADCQPRYAPATDTSTFPAKYAEKNLTGEYRAIASGMTTGSSWIGDAAATNAEVHPIFQDAFRMIPAFPPCYQPLRPDRKRHNGEPSSLSKLRQPQPILPGADSCRGNRNVTAPARIMFDGDENGSKFTARLTKRTLGSRMLLANPQTIVSQPTTLSAREDVFSYLHLVRRHFT